MTPEQIERLRHAFDGVEDVRALLAEWEERGRALDRAAIARGEAESLIEERGREIERLEAEHRQELRERTGEYIAAMEQMQAEIERLKAQWDTGVHAGMTATAEMQGRILALSDEIERLKAESEGRRKVLVEKAEEAKREWLRAEQAEARLERVVETAKWSALVSYTPVDGEAIHVVPVSVVLAAAQEEEP